MTHAVQICFVLLFGSPAGSAPVESFPCEMCDFVVECNDAEALLNVTGSELLLEEMFALMIGAEFVADRAAVAGRDEGELVRALLAAGVMGGRVDEETGEVEWIGWIAASPEAGRELMAGLQPVRQLDRLVVPEMGIAVAQLGEGVLVSSEPPGTLRAQALQSMANATEENVFEQVEAPVVATIRHAPGAGAIAGTPGTSTMSLGREERCLVIQYRGRFKDDVVQQPCCQRRLNVEVLERLPEGMIAVFVEHADADILPGASFLERLLPQLVEPEPPDERWARRLIVLGETDVADGGTRLPSLAIAIEADGPGASARRQDLAVLAALNSLRNRLGTKAGLQHLPAPADLPESGTRTIYARALFDPALQGHPIAREISINWCVTEGPSNWHLYATCPDLAGQVSDALSAPARELSCVNAAHVGRMDARRAAEHLRSWGPMAQQFVGDNQIADFRSSIDLFARMLSDAESLDWTISVPDTRSIDATIRVWPGAMGSVPE